LDVYDAFMAVRIASTRLMVGMEIHVELATRSKMFSRSANVAHPAHFDAPPNSLVDPVVAALPGALPVMNKAAIEMAVMVGLALNCTVSRFSKWDRKNYFYPDLPKGYQISQYDLPLCSDGAFDLPLEDGGARRIGIIRAHLEEDTGKLGHELPGGFHYEGSLIDLNRAGTPLLEIVTHPDLETADEAVAFAQEIRNICRFLGVTEGIMQRGHMRFEPNINVVIDTDDGREFRTPIVEVKNLNSFKSLRGAIEYEQKRQIEAFSRDGVVMGSGTKRTRGWDDVRGVTVLQREKEDAHDYRYFPEPDIPPVVIDEQWQAEIAARIPELPLQRRERYIHDDGLQRKDAIAITSERDLCVFFEAAVESLLSRGAMRMARPHAARETAKVLLNAGAKRANERGVAIHQLGIEPGQIAQIIELRERGRMGSTAADELFGLLCEPMNAGLDAESLALARGLLQVSDAAELDRWIEQAIAQQEQAARDFASGKDAALGRVVGAVMKISGGRADAAAIRQRLHARLRPQA
jgi:aspartyl-tRNA(Asn)/glutamyl-tRNA(Gln) amidotransferase subunit B